MFFLKNLQLNKNQYLEYKEKLSSCQVKNDLSDKYRFLI